MFLVSSINRVILSSACGDLHGNHLTRRQPQRLFRAAYEQRRGAAGSRAIHSNHGTLGAAFHAAAPSARAPVAQEFRRPLRWYPVRVLT